MMTGGCGWREEAVNGGACELIGNFTVLPFIRRVFLPSDVALVSTFFPAHFSGELE